MRRAMLLIVCAVAAVMFGCVPSIQPLFTEKDAVFLPELIGTWVSADGKTKFTFSKGDGNDYDVTCTEEQDRTGKLKVRVGKIGEETFFDTSIKSAEDAGVRSGYAAFHLVPSHMFSRFRLKGDTLSYATLNQDWLKKMRAEKKELPRHEVVDEAILLTGSTEELKAFIAKNLGTADAFMMTQELRKQK